MLPLVSPQPSPWDAYAARQRSSVQTGAFGGIDNIVSPSATSLSSQSQSHISQAQTQPPLRSQPSFRDQIQPKSPINNGPGSISSTVGTGVLGGRGSLASVTPLNLNSRNTMPYNESIPSSMNGSETSLNMWNDEQTKSPSPRQVVAVLTVLNLPGDLTLREAQFIFALAPDLVSVDVSRNAVSGDITISAKFSSVQSAQNVSVALERRTDIFSNEVKVTVQQYAQNLSSQSTQRSLYQRPLFGDSYWSQQSMSPIGTASGNNTSPGSVGSVTPGGTSAVQNDLFSNPRRPSHISPLETHYPTSQLGQVSVTTNSSPTSMAYDPNTSLHSQPGSSPSNGSPRSSIPGGAGTINHMGKPITSPPNSAGTMASMETYKIPPPNPADQNPPCNTLYVGNLPPDTSETELKDLFSRQPGYRRLCFRTKQNGPMCFVEFEDEVLAGRTLMELYGVALSNSVKGGIRLSYSKNPLGVKSRPSRIK